jgi:hypothetical protein
VLVVVIVVVVVVVVVEEQMLEPEEPRHDKCLGRCDCKLDWNVEQEQPLGDFRHLHSLNNWAWHRL